MKSNYVNEGEAGTRWCPFARADAYPALESGVTVNRGGTTATIKDCMCIASNCMAWRWLPSADSTTNPRGFCGLAGAP